MIALGKHTCQYNDKDFAIYVGKVNSMHIASVALVGEHIFSADEC